MAGISLSLRLSSLHKILPINIHPLLKIQTIYKVLHQLQKLHFCQIFAFFSPKPGMVGCIIVRVSNHIDTRGTNFQPPRKWSLQPGTDWRKQALHRQQGQQQNQTKNYFQIHKILICCAIMSLSNVYKSPSTFLT